MIVCQEAMLGRVSRSRVCSAQSSNLLRGEVLHLGRRGSSSHQEHTEITAKHRKAKAGQLNLVFILLKLVLIVGKLCVCVFVSLSSV